MGNSQNRENTGHWSRNSICAVVALLMTGLISGAFIDATSDPRWMGSEVAGIGATLPEA